MPYNQYEEPEDWLEDGDVQQRPQYHEWVPTEHLAPMLEWDRNEHGDPAKVQAVQQSLLTQGFKNPVFVDFNPDTKLAHVSEGNHRLTAAIQAGIPAVPVTVYRSGRHRPEVSRSYQYVGPEKDPHDPNYVPQYMLPSHIGMPTTEPWSPQHTGSWTDIGGPNDPVQRSPDSAQPSWEVLTDDATRVERCEHGKARDKCELCGRHAASEDELHIALQLPAHIADEIEGWVAAQDWPEGTQLEDRDDYHITLLYAKDGHDDHADADWLRHSEGYDVKVTGVDEFGDEEPKAIVLRIDSPEVLEHANDLLDMAERRELDISRFPGGYKPHITVAYGPHKPAYIRAPKLKFKTGPSEVSTPRVSRIATQNCPLCQRPAVPGTASLVEMNNALFHEQCADKAGLDRIYDEAHGIRQENGYYDGVTTQDPIVDPLEWEMDYPLPEKTRRQLGPIRQGHKPKDYTRIIEAKLAAMYRQDTCPQCGAPAEFTQGSRYVGTCNHTWDIHPVEQFKQDMNALPEAYSPQGDRCPQCKYPNLMRMPQDSGYDALICPECKWGGESFEKTAMPYLPEGFNRINLGEYETPDGRYLLYRLQGVNPPAWNVEDTETFEIIVDGARTVRDAVGLFQQWQQQHQR
jgi:2'-5' RNA ligase